VLATVTNDVKIKNWK